MSKNPWLKFYPTDWRGDQALRICSIEARGLWIEMLCIMHSSDPYGHLLVNGQPVTDTQIAALTGIDMNTVSRLKTELENAGVYSTNGKGVIYSRRMTRDHKKAKLCGQASKGRWNQGAENQDDNPPPKRSSNRSPIGPPTTQNPSPYPDFKNPPLPPNGHDGGFDILNLISEDGLMDARSHAPGWDIQGYLAPIYTQSVRNGKLQKPRSPNKAFPAWCKSYTKGKRPQ